MIHLLHLNDTHLNSYSFPSWYPGKRTWSSLDPLWKSRLWFVAALVNKLVNWCAWLLSSALEILRLRLRLEGLRHWLRPGKWQNTLNSSNFTISSHWPLKPCDQSKYKLLSHFLILSTRCEIVPWLPETYYYEILKNVVTFCCYTFYSIME